MEKESFNEYVRTTKYPVVAVAIVFFVLWFLFLAFSGGSPYVPDVNNEEDPRAIPSDYQQYCGPGSAC